MSARHFLTLLDLSADELDYLIQRGITIKNRLKTNGPTYTPFSNRTLAMIFEKSSTRTRVSFETAMAQFGGHALFLSSRDTQLGRGEPIGDTSDNLKAAVAGETHEYTDLYPGMVRTARDEGFDEIADWFKTLAKAEKSHAGRFQKALGTLDS